MLSEVVLLQTYYYTHMKTRSLEKCEGIGEAIFDIPFMIQNHAESMKKILGAL